MDLQNQINPHFPPHFSAENATACDISMWGVVAVASGNCVHFSYIDKESIVRGYSYSFSDNIITSIKFHVKDNLAVIGDSKGHVFLFDVDERKIVAMNEKKDENPIVSIEWSGNIIMTLQDNKILTGYTYSESSFQSSNAIIQFFEIWKIEIPDNYKKVQIDKMLNKYLLFSGKNKIFSLYCFDKFGEKPVCYLNKVELNGTGAIVDVKWASHLPYFVYILLDNDLFLFNIETQGLTQITPRNTNSIGYKFLQEISTDHKRLFIFHQSGTISCLKIKKDYNIIFEKEISFQQNHQKFINYCISPLDEKYIVFWFVPLGLALFDISKMKIVSISSLYLSKICNFDTDGISLTYSTSNGEIICTYLYDINKTLIFKVSKSPIQFVSYCSSLNQVYWHNSKEIGVIDLNFKETKILSSNISLIIKAMGSFQGGFMVQRSSKILGIFVNNQEKTLLLKNDIITFCLDDFDSSITEGRFCVLNEMNELEIYKYDQKDVTFLERIRNVFINQFSVTCMSWKENLLFAGTSEGKLIRMNLSKKSKKSFLISKFPIKKLHFVNYETIVGMTSQDQLFIGTTNHKVIKSNVTDFYPITKELILVLSPKGYLYFLYGSDYQPLPYKSNLFKVPNKDYFIAEKLNNYYLKDPFFSREARDFWLCISGKPPLRTIALTYIKNQNKIRNILISLINKSSLLDSTKKRLIFTLLFYSNEYEEAADVLTNVESDKEQFISSILLSVLISDKNQEKNVKQISTLKMAAISLFSNQKFEEGAMLLHLAGLDKLAVDYLFEYDESSIALRFLLNPKLKEEEKKELLLRFGGYLLRNGHVKESIPFFVGCEEYHPLLYALYTLQEIPDCYFIKRYAEKNHLLKSLDSNIIKIVGNIFGLEELCNIIDAEFKSILSSLNIDVSKYYEEIYV